jgi:hypothetical protein
MTKYFPGVTHCLIRTPETADDMKAMKDTIAIVSLCFGDDRNLFCPIRIKKMAPPATGVFAEIPMSPIVDKSKKKWGPVLTGQAADEAKMLALVAFDKVLQKYGLKYNKKFRVFAKDIEELIGQESQKVEIST